MDKPQRKPNRISGYDYGQDGAYFITICTHDRKKNLSKMHVGTPLLGCPQTAYLELLPHGEIADRMIRQMDNFYKHLSVDKYVIMPDHIHLLISLQSQDGHPGRGVPTKGNARASTIAQFVGSFKRLCNKEYGGNIWQERYYDHVVRNQQDYDEIWQYIDNNPWKWAVQNRILE